MAIFLLLGWWYGRGWAWVAKGIARQFQIISETFSVRMLLRTWFSPWKQIKSSSDMSNFISAAADNLVSRLVGVTVRTIMLVTAVLASMLVAVFGLAALALWPALPLLVIILPVLSLMTGGSYGL